MEILRLSDSPLPVFDCGSMALNTYLVTHARAGQRAGVSATHIAMDGDTMLGYVTLALATVRFEVHERPRGATTVNLPALLVAQLAVALKAQGTGLGARLLGFAQGIAQSIRHQAGCRFLAVDCDAALAPYYSRYGFKESKGEMRARKKLLREQGEGAPTPRQRLHRDVLAEDWGEADGAPPHLQSTELHTAAERGDVEMLTALLSAGVNPNLSVGRGDDGMGWGAKALHVAVAHGQTAAIKLLLARGAEINGVDGDCETALHWAVRHDREDVVATLLKYGAYPSVEGGAAVMTPLDYAVHSGLMEIARLELSWVRWTPSLGTLGLGGVRCEHDGSTAASSKWRRSGWSGSAGSRWPRRPVIST